MVLGNKLSKFRGHQSLAIVSAVLTRREFIQVTDRMKMDFSTDFL